MTSLLICCLTLLAISTLAVQDRIFTWMPGGGFNSGWYLKEVSLGHNFTATCGNVSTETSSRFTPKIQTQNGQPFVNGGYEAKTKTWLLWTNGDESGSSGTYSVKPFTGQKKLLTKMTGGGGACAMGGPGGYLYSLVFPYKAPMQLLQLNATTGKVQKVITTYKSKKLATFFPLLASCFWNPKTSSFLFLDSFTLTQVSLTMDGKVSTLKPAAGQPKNIGESHSVGFDTTLQRWNFLVERYSKSFRSYFYFVHYTTGSTFTTALNVSKHHHIDINYRSHAWSQQTGNLYTWFETEKDNLIIVNTKKAKARVFSTGFDCSAWGLLVTATS